MIARWIKQAEFWLKRSDPLRFSLAIHISGHPFVMYMYCSLRLTDISAQKLADISPFVERILIPYLPRIGSIDFGNGVGRFALPAFLALRHSQIAGLERLCITVGRDDETLISAATGATVDSNWSAITSNPHLRRLDISIPEGFEDLYKLISWTNLTHIRVQRGIAIPLLYSILCKASAVVELSVKITQEYEGKPRSTTCMSPTPIKLDNLKNLDFRGSTNHLYNLLSNAKISNLLHLTIRVDHIIEKCEVPPLAGIQYLQTLKSLVILSSSITGCSVQGLTNLISPCQNLNHLVVYSRIAEYSALFQALTGFGQAIIHPNLQKVDLWVTNTWPTYLLGSGEEQPYFTPSSFLEFSKHHPEARVVITDCRLAPSGDPTEILERRRRRRCEMREELLEEGLDESMWPTMKSKPGYLYIGGCTIDFQGDNTVNQDLRGEWEQWWKMETNGQSRLDI